jgi:AraC family transcriptional regulator of adaptative response/methylated-DNA-[protein]-cysteine methyltransferase
VVEVIELTLELMKRPEPTAMDEEACWQVALSRDTSMDGVFVVAVKSTGIYCRPSCPARRPRRENVVFFAGCDDAEAAGYRACKRCHPRLSNPDASAELVRKACDYLEEDGEESMSLAVIGRRLGVTAGQLQRLFRRTLGVTPKQYAGARRLERLKHGLRDGASVTRALYDAGYSSSSRLYESSGEQLGMTPATYRKGGRGVTVRYHITDSALGRLLVAATERGVCAVQVGDTDAELGVSLRAEFPRALIEPDDGRLAAWAEQIIEHLEGARPRLDLPLDVQGTAFQCRVWRALQEIAYGTTRTYSEIARAIGRPRAVRAVGNACGSNPVPIVIPCHRVVRSNGDLGGYGLGVERKRRLLEQERQRRVASGR